MEKEENNKSLIIIIVILSIVIVGLLSFISYDKLINKEGSQSNNDTKEEVDKKQDENEENNVTGPVALDQNELNELKNITNELLRIKYIQKNTNLNDVNKISNQDLLYYAIGFLNSDVFGTHTAEEVENVIQNLVGTEYKIKHENLKCDIGCKEPYYIYNSSTKKYTYNNEYPASEFDKSFRAYSKYINSSKSGDTYIISFKIAYSNAISGEDFVDKYYKSVSDALNNKNVLFKCPTNSYNEPVKMNDTYFEQFESKLPVTTFTYEKNSNGTFNLKSISVK